MSSTPTTEELIRLKSVGQYGGCDTDAALQDDLNDYALVAAQICKAPIALVSLVEGERVHFRASVGLKLSGVPRGESFCHSAIKQADLFIVCDALDDERFAKSRLVALDPFVRFYAGVPLITAEGKAIGTLSVMDHTRRSLGRGQRDSLRALARQVMRRLELRCELANAAKHNEALALATTAVREARRENPSSDDAVTGLPDQALFKERLAETILSRLAAPSPYETTLAVMFVNIDRFRTINETLGYEVGDLLLREVAGRLSACVAAKDTVARFGSDEFALVLASVADTGEAEEVAQQILDALSLPFGIGGQELFITASVGISFFPCDGRSAPVLLKNAGIALSRAKDQDGNNYQLYTSGRTARALKNLVLENSLRRGLEREEFILHYQPQVNMRSGFIVGMEALVRWQHPELGLVSPTEFIPLAEESGMIITLGEWILRTACAQNRAWQEAGFAPLRISINISARQFQQPNLVEVVARTLTQTGLDSRYLELELTESSIMANPEQAIKRLRELKEMGVQLSIDDFGTGYSSLNYLKRFPLNTLKIDQSFVRDISSDPDDAAIVKAIITLAHSLKLNVIAEGVETDEQFTFLRLLRCDEMQGFGFSKPLAAEEAHHLLIDRQRAIDASPLAPPAALHLSEPAQVVNQSL